VISSEAQLLRALHDEHAGALWSYVVSLIGGDHARAQDVVQETLLRAWRHPSVLDQSTRSARGWLFTVARNLVIDESRSGHRRQEVAAELLPEPAGDDDTDRVLQAWLVAEALRKLSEAHRQALVECFYRGHSVVEVAARLGVPAGTVKPRLHYGLRALRLALEEMGVSSRT
jgi:RNA polymerase sigma-70 factor, ECF subfamily